MTLLLPILGFALLMGLCVRRMTPAVWFLLALVICAATTLYFAKH